MTGTVYMFYSIIHVNEYSVVQSVYQCICISSVSAFVSEVSFDTLCFHIIYSFSHSFLHIVTLNIFTSPSFLHSFLLLSSSFLLLSSSFLLSSFLLLSFFHSSSFFFSFKDNKVAEEEAARLATLEAEEEEDDTLNNNLDSLDLSPYELALYLEEQRKKRWFITLYCVYLFLFFWSLCLYNILCMYNYFYV